MAKVRSDPAALNKLIAGAGIRGKTGQENARQILLGAGAAAEKYAAAEANLHGITEESAAADLAAAVAALGSGAKRTTAAFSRRCRRKEQLRKRRRDAARCASRRGGQKSSRTFSKTPANRP